MDGALVYGLAFGPSHDGQELDLFMMGSNHRVRLGENARLVIAFVVFGNHGDEAAYFSLVNDESVPICGVNLAPGGQECCPYYLRPISLSAGRLPRLVADGEGGVMVLGAIQHHQGLDLGMADAA